jgi:hypothetical protein
MNRVVGALAPQKQKVVVDAVIAVLQVGHGASNDRIGPDFGLAAPLRSASSPKAVHSRRWNRKIRMTRAEAQRMTGNEISTRVIEAAIAVHRELGPGLLDMVYEVILARLDLAAEA